MFRPPGAAPAQSAGTKRMIERLKALPRDVDPEEVPYFAGETARFFQRKIAAATSAVERLSLMPRYANALLNDGRSQAALEALQQFDAELERNGIQPPPGEVPKITLLKAIACLRLGEQENCLNNHNADSCLLPIRGGGVHVAQRGSRATVGVLNELLQTDPTPYAVWLLNIAHMTLGEYPDQVPQQWRVPPQVFDSDYDIKRFPDVAGALGVDVDDLSGGVVLDDFDNDGLLDLMVSASGLDSPLRVFRNNGDGTFTERTREAGLDGLTGGLNLIQGDFDNDGFVDVLVLRGGWLGKDGRYPNSLLRNNGDFTFTDVTEEAGVLSLHSTQTAVWLDYNGDGWLDLFIGNETVPDSGVSDPCELFRNNGDGTFTECAQANGVAIVAWVKAVVSGDFNNDGRPDLYLSVFGGDNILLRNDGPATRDDGPAAAWHFTDVAAAAGVTAPVRSFPCWFWDYDNDGWLDLFVCGYAIQNAGDILADYMGMGPPQAERPRLYHNNHDGTFTDVTRDAGLYKVLEAMGANFGDLDNDGWLDFLVGTGDPSYGTLIPNRMFRNDGGAHFQDVTTSGGFGQLQKGHGVAYGDINNDGAQDVYEVVGGALAGDHYPNQLFANPGHGNHWLKLRLEGVESNRAAIGARITVVAKDSGGERAICRVVGSGGDFGASPLRQEIGLGAATAIGRVEISWPATGTKQVLTGLEPDRCYAVREGDRAASEVKLTRFAWPADTGGHHHHMMPEVGK
ncbi:MAG TPA: CRTAC1 family protein [Opitutus sp.]|nr:CRTAC1 family protein [Opitutus sp.]